MLKYIYTIYTTYTPFNERNSFKNPKKVAVNQECKVGLFKINLKYDRRCIVGVPVGFE